METEIGSKIRNLKSFAVDILKEMIDIPTIVPPGENYEEFVQYAKSIMEDIGLKTRTVKVPKRLLEKFIPEMADHPRYILIGEVGDGRPILHLNGHYDVVPAAEDWKPFRSIIRKGRIYGRGSSDMKGGIASILTAAKAIIDGNDGIINGSLQISLTPDEEIGGQCGAGYLVNLIDRPDWVIVAEPSSCENVWIGHKGVIWGEIEVRGVSAHASTPDEGKNAVESCIKIANSLLKLKSKIEKRRTEFECNVKRATFNLTQIEGGRKINVIPDRAVIRFDRRVLPEENFDAAMKEIAEIAEFKTILSVEPFLNENSKLADVVLDILGRRGIRGKKAISSGFMDTRYFGVVGSDVIAFGPGDLSQAHKANEFVEIEKVLLASEVFVEVALKLLKMS